jgi:hypothetical protein
MSAEAKSALSSPALGGAEARRRERSVFLVPRILALAGISRALLNIDTQGVNEKSISGFVESFSAFASMAKGAGLPPIDSASVVAPLIFPQPTVGHLLAELVKMTHVASVHLACAVICTFFPEASPPPATLATLNSFCSQFAVRLAV